MSKETPFVDEISIHLVSGSGGPGCVSFRRESHVPRGGPDGGDGGKGGDVILRTNPHMRSLYQYKSRKKIKAASGLPGESRKKSGAQGEDLIIDLPIGTKVWDLEKQTLLFDLSEDAQSESLLVGGRGGKGNFFFRTSVNQAPEHSQTGEAGIEIGVRLELQLMADVGLVGLPNAGKSSLLRVLSQAKPKVASYPFTTLQPQLGVLEIQESYQLVIADMPGLIKGAHEGVGLGLEFLKHVSRAEFLCHVVELGMEENTNDIIEKYELIQNELKQYDNAREFKSEGSVKLSDRPSMLVVNKMDLVSRDKCRVLQDELRQKGLEAHFVSTVHLTGIDKLKEVLFQKVGVES